MKQKTKPMENKEKEWFNQTGLEDHVMTYLRRSQSQKQKKDQNLLFESPKMIAYILMYRQTTYTEDNTTPYKEDID